MEHESKKGSDDEEPKPKKEAEKTKDCRSYLRDT